jgi:mannose-1-phosphate guanylyltransferase
MRYAVIMAGGAGTRLWPAARQEMPKQLQRLIFDRPLIAETVQRMARHYSLERILIVTAARYADPIREVVPELPAENIISEPFGRNTAAAIALAAFRIARDNPEAVFAVFPADHVVLKPEVLFAALDFAGELAQQHRVVDIGVPPSHPETGYGYIELGERIGERNGVEAFAVRRFVEKPSREKAEEYLAAGNYIWNSGMFVWRAGEYLDALRTHLPNTYNRLEAAIVAGDEALAEAYAQIEDISVDYAIMEKTSDVVAVPADCDWRDIGDWAALYDMMDHDPDGNAFSGEHVTLDTTNSLLIAPGKLVAAIGVSDLILVEQGDVVLVMRRDRAQDVKKILDQLKETGRDRYL